MNKQTSKDLKPLTPADKVFQKITCTHMTVTKIEGGVFCHDCRQELSPEELETPLRTASVKPTHDLYHDAPYKEIRDGKEVNVCPSCHTTIHLLHFPNGPDDYRTDGECPGCGAYFDG